MKKWNVWMSAVEDIVRIKRPPQYVVRNSGRTKEGRLFTRLDSKDDPVIVIEANTKSEARAVFKKLAGLRKKEKLRPGLRFKEAKCQ